MCSWCLVKHSLFLPFENKCVRFKTTPFKKFDLVLLIAEINKQYHKVSCPVLSCSETTGACCTASWYECLQDEKTHSWCCQLSLWTENKPRNRVLVLCRMIRKGPRHWFITLSSPKLVWGTTVYKSWNVKMFFNLQSRLIGAGQRKCKFHRDFGGRKGRHVRWLGNWSLSFTDTEQDTWLLPNNSSDFCPIIHKYIQ